MGTIFQLIELGAYQLERYPGCHFTFIDPRIAKDEDAIVQKVRRLLGSHCCPNRVDGRRCHLHFCCYCVPGIGPESEPDVPSKRDPSPVNCFQCTCTLLSYGQLVFDDKWLGFRYLPRNRAFAP